MESHTKSSSKINNHLSGKILPTFLHIPYALLSQNNKYQRYTQSPYYHFWIDGNGGKNKCKVHESDLKNAATPNVSSKK